MAFHRDGRTFQPGPLALVWNHGDGVLCPGFRVRGWHFSSWIISRVKAIQTSPASAPTAAPRLDRRATDTAPVRDHDDCRCDSEGGCCRHRAHLHLSCHRTGSTSRPFSLRSCPFSPVFHSVERRLPQAVAHSAHAMSLLAGRSLASGQRQVSATPWPGRRQTPLRPTSSCRCRRVEETWPTPLPTCARVRSERPGGQEKASMVWSAAHSGFHA
mmetsp:Transcript_9340/g.20114  ORF Transcript_9340/g.20114 Transcript_9340/m.20114 type:complete len:214 (-) Transcript_9340:36-677(-)